MFIWKVFHNGFPSSEYLIRRNLHIGQRANCVIIQWNYHSMCSSSVPLLRRCGRRASLLEFVEKNHAKKEWRLRLSATASQILQDPVDRSDRPIYIEPRRRSASPRVSRSQKSHRSRTGPDYGHRGAKKWQKNGKIGFFFFLFRCLGSLVL